MPGLKTTFDFLASTPNPTAVPVLIAALQVADPRIRTLAVDALLQRRSAPAHLEVVRRLQDLPRSAWDVLEKHKGVLGSTLRHCLLGTDESLQRNALKLTELLEDYAQIPTLLNLLERQQDAIRMDVPPVLSAIVNRLYEHLQFGREAPPQSAVHKSGAKVQPPAAFLRDAQRIRHLTLASLEASAQRFPLHSCTLVIEAVFILGDSENVLVKRLLRESPEFVREVAEEVLWTSTHPAVLHLICDSFNQNYPILQTLAAFERRRDPEFVSYVLRQWPRRLTTAQQRNYQEIKSLPWLSKQQLDLEMIPAGLQKQLTSFVIATSLPEDDKLTALEWLVRHGGPEGRLAATQVLAGVSGDRVQHVVLDGLESKVPDVQAWATHQLRSRDVPGAIEKLVERLDSPLTEVRSAAQAELGDFNIHRVLEMYDELDPKVAAGVGQLVRKIDPETISKLKSEMHHSILRRRIRAVRCAEKLGIHTELIPQIAMMLQDPDPIIRRTAIEVLGTLPKPPTGAISPLLHDPSPRVREAAAEVLGSRGLVNAWSGWEGEW